MPGISLSPPGIPCFCSGWLLQEQRIVSAFLLLALVVFGPDCAHGAPKGTKSDLQKVGVWKGAKFEWQNVDPSLVRPVRFEIRLPAADRFFTVAIDDTNGVRVRNLLDMARTVDFGGNTNGTAPQTLSVEWNGLDDRGEPVPEGTYRVRGISHPGVTLNYDYTLLGPGTPPWEGYPNSAWGGDHEFPSAIACLPGAADGPWRVALGGATAEGGSPGFVLDGNDRKVFVFGNGWTGPNALAAHDSVIWAGLGRELIRSKYHTGARVPFLTATGEVKSLKFEDKDTRIHALAVNSSRAALILRPKEVKSKPKPDRLLLLNAKTGQTLLEFSLPFSVAHNGLTFAGGERLLLASDSGILSWDPGSGTNASNFQTFPLPEVQKPEALASDKSRNLYVYDAGPDQQVKVFDLNRAFLRTLGTKGGNSSATYDPNAFHKPSAISVADDGSLWVAEGNKYEKRWLGFARRIAVWNANGEFSRHFIGGTWYGANQICLHEQDPALAYAYGVIYEVEPGQKPAYKPLRYASSRRQTKSPFQLWTGSPGVLFGSTRVFRSSVSGQSREYLLQANGYPILYQADATGDYRPVLAIGSHQHNTAFPEVKEDKRAVFIWTDLNADEQAQANEFVRVKGGSTSVSFFSGWGYPPPLDLAWRLGGWEFKPSRFTETGVPVYDEAHTVKLASPHHFLRVGQHLISPVAGKNGSPEAGWYFAGNLHFTDLAGRRTAHYRFNWPAVHASWSSTLYKPGQTGRSIGENFFSGIADSGGEIGHVIATHGNKGQAFVLSEDGLFVTTLFSDPREGPKGQGSTEKRGADWTRVTMNEEAFGGWFGRQADGKLRYLFGHTAAHVVQVLGLDNVKRFDAGLVRITTSTSMTTSTVKGKPAQQRAAGSLHIPNVRGAYPPFKADGETHEWSAIPRQEIKLGDDLVARVALAHDLDHLWILAEVADPSPALNSAREPNLLFKTGDAIELQFGPARPARTSPVEGDIRIIIAPSPKKPLAMKLLPIKKEARPEEGFTFESPVRKVPFASVTPLKNVEAKFVKTASGYICEAKLNCDTIALSHAASGLRLLGDIGIILSNEGGESTQARAYLFDHSPGASITADVPSEAELHPAEWGQWLLE